MFGTLDETFLPIVEGTEHAEQLATAAQAPNGPLSSESVARPRFKASAQGGRSLSLRTPQSANHTDPV